MATTDAMSLFEAARAAGRTALDEAAGKRLLAGFGIRVPQAAVVRGPAQAESALAGMTPPFVVKVMAPAILHKSDVGGVRLHLADGAAVAEAIAEMQRLPAIEAARVEGFLVEEMASPGREVVVGGLHDPQFGPMVMVGLGGIFVEVLKDVAFRLCPITKMDAAAMLGELKGAALLKGVRGEAPVDIDALVELMVRVGGADGLLMAHGGAIAELDLNPVIATATGAVAVDARVILRAPSAQAATPARAPADALTARERFRPLFEPKTVSVLGASSSGVTIANTFIRRMKEFGYSGTLYPIHPKAAEIEGFAAYPSVSETPEPVDYAYIAIASSRIPEVLGAAAGRVKMAQVISSGFAEVEEGRALEAELIEKARRAGARVLGPNCLGTYSPRGGLTFPDGAPREVGTIGVVSQSGGLTTDIIKRGQWRGLRFSGAVTIGNSADVTPCELVEFYLEDEQTRAIGLYLEDIKDGRAFFELLRAHPARKPVVILRGGRSELGRAAAASHTGALAGSDGAWQALVAQTPSVLVPTIDTFINALLAFQHLDPRADRPTAEVVLFGNGGGTSVLATDFFADIGFAVRPFAAATRHALDELDLPPGTSVANPIDTPVATLQREEGRVAGRILDIVYATGALDAIVLHLNLAAFVGRGDADPLDRLFAVVEAVQRREAGRAHFVLVLRTDGSPELDDKKRTYRERARAIGIPVYDELADAALALAAVRDVERRLQC